jgi:tetratricopeptide (TPR) repeat protein/transcriptional regulator with XRE-family HTH domain
VTVDTAEGPLAELGRRLETARRRRGWTFRDLQERTGLPRSTLHYLFRERKRAPDYYVLTALVAALGEEWDGGWERLWRAAVDDERPVTPGPVPHQLPPAPGLLTARQDALDCLDAGTGLAVLVGPGGIGKTALALHWAHRGVFPDGELYADLRGFGPAGPPLDPGTVLHGFLLALGVPAAEVPAGTEVRAALYRSLVAGRRLLVVLDNAADSAQVLPLLPGGPGCRVLVTSRAELSTLAVRGAQRLELGTLPDAAARELLARSVGVDRLAAEPAATEVLLRHCGGLPLALSVLATRIAARPDFPLAAAAAELADAGTRLDALDSGELASSVRAVLSWSYQALEPGVARLFRLLGAVGGTDVSTGAAGALVGGDAGPGLRRLAAVHLAAEHQPGRYRMHDLVRLFAAEQGAPDPGAVTRLLTWYLHTADAADRLIAPHRGHVLDRVTDQPAPPRPPGVPGFADADEALAWCDAEYENIVAALRQAEGDEAWRAGWRLPHALFGFVQLRPGWIDWPDAHERALTGVRRLGDRSGEAWALNALGIAYTRLGRLEEGGAHLRRALELRRELGDLGGEGATLNNLGELHRRAGRPDLALECHQRDLEICGRLGDAYGESISLNNLGEVQLALGRPSQALETQQRALELILALGDRAFEAEVRYDLGELHRAAGRAGAAEEEYRAAAASAAASGNVHRRAASLVSLTELTADPDDADSADAAIRDLTGADAAPLAARLAGVAVRDPAVPAPRGVPVALPGATGSGVD